MEEAVVGVVREFFSRVKRLPEGKQLQAAMKRERTAQQKALRDAQRLQVKLRISATQFFEPDKESEAMDKVS